MLSFLDPRVWMAAIVALILAFTVGDFSGRHAANKANDAKQAIADKAAMDDKIAGDKKLVRSIDAITDNSEKVEQNAKIKTDAVIATLRAGTERLRCPASPNSQAVNTGSGPAEAQPGLLPEAATRIYGYAREGDTIMRELNTCIDKYNEVRQQINDQP